MHRIVPIPKDHFNAVASKVTSYLDTIALTLMNAALALVVALSYVQTQLEALNVAVIMIISYLLTTSHALLLIDVHQMED